MPKNKGESWAPVSEFRGALMGTAPFFPSVLGIDAVHVRSKSSLQLKHH